MCLLHDIFTICYSIKAIFALNKFSMILLILYIFRELLKVVRFSQIDLTHDLFIYFYYLKLKGFYFQVAEHYKILQDHSDIKLRLSKVVFRFNNNNVLNHLPLI